MPAYTIPERGSVSLDENTAEYLSTIMEQRRIIDVLVAALEDARSQIEMEWGEGHSRLEKINAALAMARKGG